MNAELEGILKECGVDHLHEDERTRISCIASIVWIHQQQKIDRIAEKVRCVGSAIASVNHWADRYLPEGPQA